jgi:NRAMP (natural resistance-associated macrophage protein)-like metal ion transporter
MTVRPDEAITEEELAAAEAPEVSKRRSNQKGPGHFLRFLGPGIVTGAADDDPSGIVTYSQAGAQFGLAAPWMMLFTYPIMTAVQEACMRIGAVTGKGLAAVIKERFPKWLLLPTVLLVVVANTLNIGADISAMAASTNLIVPIPYPALAIMFSLLMIILEVFVPYKSYAKMLKWLALALFSYVITAFLVNVPWLEVIKATFIPKVQFNPAFLYIFVGVLGTTISPYLFFWQASEMVEDEIAAHRLAQSGGVPRLSKKYLKSLRWDTVFGMLFSNVMSWFIIIVSAVVLHQAGVLTVNSAADAAKALEPLVNGFPNAGTLAKIIFSVGVVGIGLMSVPVLAGSSSYAIAEAFGWNEGLFRKFASARAFYLVIILSTLVGLGMNFAGIDPIKALVFSAVFNGVASVPLIAIIYFVSRRRDVMGEHASGFWSQTGLIAAWLVMAIASGAMIISFFV